MAALVEIEELSKTYRLGGHPVPALQGVSASITAGEFVAVMGPSGSGKSTFLNLVGCLDSPSGGRYRLAGEEVSRFGRDALAGLRNRRFGFVFQNYNLLPRMSAAENVELPLIYAGRPAAERRRRALAMLDAVGLQGYARNRPSQLSGGQQQRVAIARALVNQPSLILADEPTGALDTAAGAEIMDLFAALNRQGITVVVVTHEAEVAARARRVLAFRDGRIVADTAVLRQGAAAP